MLADIVFPECFKMADLGCSSGPNCLFLISLIIHKIQELSGHNNNYRSHSPEFEVFLNDLHGNDFNNLFKMLPTFRQKLNPTAQCFVSGLPGSFYGRLLPSKSLHFVHSSYSLHWLSQVPEGVESNRNNIHMGTASPPAVFEAYLRQFQRDFSTFLSSRGEEMVPGGRMVLTFIGRSVADPYTKDDCIHIKILGDTLLDMIVEGAIKEVDLHSFNMPFYTPSKQEVEAIIRSEGSFNLERLDHFLLPWNSHDVEHSNSDNHRPDKYKVVEMVTNSVRAYTEPLLSIHFGSFIMDVLFTRFGKKLAEHLSMEEPSFFNIVISLSKR
ncbi:UNVERIFIED_CONTAM: Benzoate carboxyl methyltransferase [Sesamum calycinum]|uniref:Benzoate carboxyl methyltransferase n=1 Tax=Sesamum calycinum TaxID=2727403 RepID=A0AAW2NT98_9LAMI